MKLETIIHVGSSRLTIKPGRAKEWSLKADADNAFPRRLVGSKRELRRTWEKWSKDDRCPYRYTLSPVS